MSGYFKNEPAYAVIGDLQQQYSFAQIIKSMLKDMFGTTVKNVQVASKSPFYIYDADAVDVEIYINGMTIQLSPEEQGAIAVLRYCIKRKIGSVHKAIFEEATNIFSPAFFNHFFVKQDWDNGPIYKNINDVQLVKTV